MTVRVRFAPSPTGKVHVGNVRTALVNVLFARKTGGQFILRFEDTDLERQVDDAEQNMLAALKWLGMTPDESIDHGGDFGPYRTRERDARGDYKAALDKLFGLGLAYECFVSKDELDMIRRLRTSRGLPSGYDNRHRDLTEAEREAFRKEGRVPVIRFKLLDGEILFEDMVRGSVRYEAQHLGGDPVIVRSNGMPTFAFAGAVDDINQKMTHIIRGEDHVTNTAIQVRIFEALSGGCPKFAHLPMMLDHDGGKLSKRLDSLSITQLQERGYMAEAIVSYLAAIGTSVDPTLGTIDELAERFDFAKMGRAPVRFDLDQVDRLNAQIIHQMPWGEVKDRMRVLTSSNMDEATLETFWYTVRPNLKRLEEVTDQFNLCFAEIQPANLGADDASYIRAAEETLPKGPYTKETWGQWVGTLKEKTGRKGKELFMPLRLALTGVEHGPELADLLPLIGEDRARKRLHKAAGK